MEKDLFIYDTISITGQFILLINTILYIKSYRENSMVFKIFTNYLLFILIIQLITGYMRWHKMPNIYFSHFYFIGQFVFLSLFYILLEKKKKLRKVQKIILCIGLVAIGIYYIKYPEAYFKFNPFEIIITSIPLIVYSFYFFIKKIESIDKKYIYINSGIFLYLSCSTLLFIAGNIENTTLKITIWYSNISLYLIYQILVFVEWFKNHRRPIK